MQRKQVHIHLETATLMFKLSSIFGGKKVVCPLHRQIKFICKYIHALCIILTVPQWSFETSFNAIYTFYKVFFG